MYPSCSALLSKEYGLNYYMGLHKGYWALWVLVISTNAGVLVVPLLAIGAVVLVALVLQLSQSNGVVFHSHSQQGGSVRFAKSAHVLCGS